MIKRLIVYPKDIEMITGRSPRYARNLHLKIRRHYNKQSHQYLSVKEFCDYMGLESDKVQEILL